MPLAIGAAGQLAAIIAAWLLTDFINGLVHIYMDHNDRYDSLAGPLVANFHLHHKTPLYRKNPLPIVYFMETGSKIWLVGYLLGVALLLALTPLQSLTACLLVYYRHPLIRCRGLPLPLPHLHLGSCAAAGGLRTAALQAPPRPPPPGGQHQLCVFERLERSAAQPDRPSLLSGLQDDDRPAFCRL